MEGPNLPLSTTPRLSVSSLAHSSSAGASASYNSNPPPPAFKSVIPKQSKETALANIKIIRAKMESSRTGKIEFTQEAQMHLDISESTANVKHILDGMFVGMPIYNLALFLEQNQLQGQLTWGGHLRIKNTRQLMLSNLAAAIATCTVW